jgi:integrase/recombinase XerC/integrase/recombinase XerD
MAKKTHWRDMKKDAIPFAKLREQFAVYNKTTGKSPATVNWYEQKLELFERWLGPDACLADVSIPTVREYVADLQDRTTRHVNSPFYKTHEGKLSSTYIHGIVRGLRAFASWLHEDGFTETNVLRPLKPPKFQQKVTEVLTDEEVHRLVAVFDRSEPYGARAFAMIWTLLDCGLRAAELCSLKTEDAHLDQGYLKVLGKGNKERLVPIGQACQATLLVWRDRFRPQFELESAETPTLFLNSNGEPMSVNSLQLVIGRAGSRAGIPRVHAHLLRHTFATNYLVKEVGDSLRLQQILGHTSLEMVRRYVAQANVQQSLIERRASPMDLIAQNARPREQARRVQPDRHRRRTVSA